MTLFSRLVLAGGLLFSVAFFSGCVEQGDQGYSFPHYVAQGTNNVPVARLQVGDNVTVNLTVPGQDETIAPHVEDVGEDGTINMPSIGHVQAAGKTTGELASEIEALYVPKYYVRVNVVVTTANLVYYVEGEVKSPGRELYVGATSVTQAISSAGDFTDFANRQKVWLIRGKHRIKVNCEEIYSNPEMDYSVYPGDQILVTRRIF